MLTRWSTGSGVWQRGQPTSTSFFPASADGALKIAQIGSSLADVQTNTTQRVDTSTNTTAAERLQLGNKGWELAALKSAGTTTVCSGTVCCDASVSGENTEEVASKYAVAALKGSDDGGNSQWAAQVCAVLYCEHVSQATITLGTENRTLTWCCRNVSPTKPRRLQGA